MDILVTTPQSEINTSRREGEIVEQEGGYWFRTFRFKPKVENGEKKLCLSDEGQIFHQELIEGLYK